jgi:hypothetical protein
LRWGPDSSRYLLYVDERPKLPEPRSFLELIGQAQRQDSEKDERDAAEKKPDQFDR